MRLSKKEYNNIDNSLHYEQINDENMDSVIIKDDEENEDRKIF